MNNIPFHLFATEGQAQVNIWFSLVACQQPQTYKLSKKLGILRRDRRRSSNIKWATGGAFDALLKIFEEFAFV
jgi:hypothetical protein